MGCWRRHKAGRPPGGWECSGQCSGTAVDLPWGLRPRSASASDSCAGFPLVRVRGVDQSPECDQGTSDSDPRPGVSLGQSTALGHCRACVHGGDRWAGAGGAPAACGEQGGRQVVKVLEDVSRPMMGPKSKLPGAGVSEYLFASLTQDVLRQQRHVLLPLQRPVTLSLQTVYIPQGAAARCPEDLQHGPRGLGFARPSPTWEPPDCARHTGSVNLSPFPVPVAQAHLPLSWSVGVLLSWPHAFVTLSSPTLGGLRSTSSWSFLSQISVTSCTKPPRTRCLHLSQLSS